jgi:hypothetical protein
MKPDWKDAPEWAQWLAMDCDGTWCWYQMHPMPCQGAWGTTFKYEKVKSEIFWRDSIEARPGDSPNPTP